MINLLPQQFLIARLNLSTTGTADDRNSRTVDVCSFREASVHYMELLSFKVVVIERQEAGSVEGYLEVREDYFPYSRYQFILEGDELVCDHIPAKEDFIFLREALAKL